MDGICCRNTSDEWQTAQGALVFSGYASNEWQTTEGTWMFSEGEARRVW